MVVPAADVSVLPGYRLWCSATGNPPVTSTKLMWNSQMLASSTNAASTPLMKEGKYMCEATNQDGFKRKYVQVRFTSKMSLTSNGNWTEWNTVNLRSNRACNF